MEAKFGGQVYLLAMDCLKAVTLLCYKRLRAHPESESCDELAKLVDIFYHNITSLERTHQLKAQKWQAHLEKEARKAARGKS